MSVLQGLFVISLENINAKIKKDVARTLKTTSKLDSSVKSLCQLLVNNPKPKENFASLLTARFVEINVVWRVGVYCHLNQLKTSGRKTLLARVNSLQMKNYVRVLAYFGVMGHAVGLTQQIINVLWKITMEFRT